MTTTLPSRTTAHLLVRLGTDVQTLTGDGPVRVGGARGWLPITNATPGLRAALDALSGGATETTLAEVVADADGEAGLLGMHLLLARLTGSGLLEHVVDVDGSTVARLHVVGQGPTRLRPRLDPCAPVVLSRFATAAADGGRLVVRSPRSHLGLDLGPEAATVLGVLAAWTTAGAVADRLTDLPASAVEPLLRLMSTADLLAPGGPDDDAEHDPARGQWNPADLWLHAHTRAPRTVNGYGGTYHGRGHRDPEPAVPAPYGGRTVDLPRPDLDVVAAADPSLTTVLESRRSVRSQDPSAPITAAQLGELLYRTARLRRSFAGEDGEEVADRPYPSGGAVHELELYPLVTDCDGIDAGLWHYRTDTHQLELVAEPDKVTAGLVARARASSVMSTDPQVVLLVTARFGRVMYKYESIAYALVLKHVGVLYQTVYLVATAMGLAVCGLGGGDAELFASVSGRDYFTEGTVGELVLGSRSPDGDAAWTGEEQPS